MANIELDGVNKKIKVDSGDLTLDVPGDIVLDADGGDVVFADGGTNLLKVTNSSSDVVLQPQVDAKDIVFKQYDGTVVATVEDNATFNIPASKLAIGGTAVTSTAAELNILDGVTSTTAELNILDGVTATAAEINLIDGGTARGTTAIADGDGVLINDAGTMRQTTVETLKTYIGAGANAPYFAARRSNTAQTVANDTYVTIVFNTEVLDSAGTYNPSNGIWTPGTAGKYFVFAQVAFTVTNAADWDSGTIIIDKNSAGYTDTNNKNAMAYITRRSSGSGTDSFYVSQIFDLDADDTVRVQFQGGWAGASSNETVGYGKTYFGGYKLA